MTYDIKYFEQLRGDGTKYYFAEVTFTRRTKVFGLFWWTSKRTKYISASYGGNFVLLTNSERGRRGLEDLSLLKEKTQLAIDRYIEEELSKKVISYKPC